MRTFGQSALTPKKVSEYVEFMADKLQKRRIQGEYVFQATNRERVKESECIWSNPEVYQKVESFLLEHVDYYRFCQKCMDSKDRLL